MTDPLKNLSLDVREAMSHCASFGDVKHWQIVRFAIIRLADENAALLAANKDSMLHYNDCRAELAALKQRVAEAPLQRVGRHAEGLCYVHVCGLPPEWEGRRVHLLAEDDLA